MRLRFIQQGARIGSGDRRSPRVGSVALGALHATLQPFDRVDTIRRHDARSGEDLDIGLEEPPAEHSLTVLLPVLPFPLADGFSFPDSWNEFTWGALLGLFPFPGASTEIERRVEQLNADGASFGLFMPGTVLLGSRYYEEHAPGAAMDRAEIVSVDCTVKTPAGEFEHCLKVQETNPLEEDEKEYKMYAPGIGLVQDEDLVLTKYSVMKDTQ